MFSCPAACDLEEELLELVTMVIVACGGDRSCALRPYDRARCVLVYLRKHDTLEQLAAGFGIGVATAWRYVHDTIGYLAAFAPTLTEALTSHQATATYCWTAPSPRPTASPPTDTSPARSVVKV